VSLSTHALARRTTAPCIEPLLLTQTVGTLAPVLPGGECGPRRSTAVRDDLALAARLVAADEAALAEVYERFAGLVFGLARRVLNDDAMAEEVTQEVFVYLWQHPAKFDPARGSMRSWLGVLAHRRSVDRVRVEARRARREEIAAPGSHVTDAQSEVDDELSRAWLAGCVREAIDRLPPEQREAVVLAYYGNRTYRQVATELAIPEGTAKSRLRLALAKLDDLLRPSLIDQDTPAWT
jgi:RNA polymerase sigma-70 factor (ECF subfamily)